MKFGQEKKSKEKFNKNFVRIFPLINLTLNQPNSETSTKI